MCKHSTGAALLAAVFAAPASASKTTQEPEAPRALVVEQPSEQETEAQSRRQQMVCIPADTQLVDDVDEDGEPRILGRPLVPRPRPFVGRRRLLVS